MRRQRSKTHPAASKLARGIGEALRHAHKGELDYKLTQRESVVRVAWAR